MNNSRREFLKKSGLVLAGLGCAGVPLAHVLASGARTAPAASSSPRWGMVVDLAACRGRGQGDCRDCLDACRLAHNLPNLRHPEWDQRHDVKWIWKEAFDDAFPSRPAGPAAGAVPVLCNHCENPPCVRVCPTGATWKREDGLVMMDQHRCIGCRYCVAACPYGSRSFNFVDPRRFIDRPLNPDYPTRTRGVVEKCNFCAERLAVGGQPACVEACPQGALHFGDVSEPRSAVSVIKRARRVIVRKPQLGTDPHVYYLE